MPYRSFYGIVFIVNSSLHPHKPDLLINLLAYELPIFFEKIIGCENSRGARYGLAELQMIFYIQPERHDQKIKVCHWIMLAHANFANGHRGGLGLKRGAYKHPMRPAQRFIYRGRRIGVTAAVNYAGYGDAFRVIEPRIAVLKFFKAHSIARIFMRRQNLLAFRVKHSLFPISRKIYALCGNIFSHTKPVWN